MFASITCLGMDTRTRRVHVPAFADSYLPGVTVSLKAAQSTYKGPGADCLQLTLRFSFRQRLMPGVAMTSDVKGCSQFFMSSSQVPSSSGCRSEEAEPVRHDG
jgi:hypothetical protein